MKTYTKSLANNDVTFEFSEDAPEGSVKAVISRFGIVDRDGDVVEKSAFTDGQHVKMASWGHEWNRLPIGRGTIKVTNDQAIFEGKFFTSTAHGRDAYETVKELGELQEWSWGFTIPAGGSRKGAKDGRPVRFITGANIYEVCPVLVGANQETSTLAIKSASEDEEDGESELKCEGGHTTSELIKFMKDNVAAMEADDEEKQPMMAAMHSLEQVDSTDKMDGMDDAAKKSFIEEQVTASLKLYEELGINISAFLPTPSRTYAEHSTETIEAVKNLTTRTKSLADLRAKDGRSLGKSSRELLESIREELGELLVSIDVLAAPDAEETSEEEKQSTETENSNRNKLSQEAELKRAQALKVAQARSRLFASN